MTSKHTQGPWYKSGNNLTIFTEDGNIAYLSRDLPLEEIEAIALLITEAPKLLKALTVLLPLVEELDDVSFCGKEWQSHALQDAISAARAVIVEVEGGAV